jgi:hypothetical protein
VIAAFAQVFVGLAVFLLVPTEAAEWLSGPAGWLVGILGGGIGAWLAIDGGFLAYSARRRSR